MIKFGGGSTRPIPITTSEQRYFDMEDSIKKETSLEDIFAALPREDREEAYKVVRARVGPRSISLKDLVEAHKQIKKVS
jgi:hypothetical protein